MKKFFGRKKLRKSKSDISERKEQNGGPVRDGVNNTTLSTSKSSNVNFQQATCSSDDWAVCSSMSEGERKKKFDAELDKHMMQTITDVKYLLKRGGKFTAVGEVNFQRDCLDAHNAVRLKYGNPPLQWSQELADLAHSWACKVAERGRIQYPEIPGIGENMVIKEASETSHLPTGPEVVAEWEEESRFFDFQKPKWNPMCQRFSQMVWKDTQEVGIAREFNTTKNCVAVVAFYRPGGNNNAPGEFATNVPSRDASMSPSRTLSTQIKRVQITTPEHSNHK